MVKQTKVKTEQKSGTAMTFGVWIISLYAIYLGFSTDVKDPRLVYPFSFLFTVTSIKLCKIEHDITHTIKKIIR